MGLFSIDYIDVPGQCVYGKSGLKFRGDEARLRQYFADILPMECVQNFV